MHWILNSDPRLPLFLPAGGPERVTSLSVQVHIRRLGDFPASTKLLEIIIGGPPDIEPQVVTALVLLALHHQPIITVYHRLSHDGRDGRKDSDQDQDRADES